MEASKFNIKCSLCGEFFTGKTVNAKYCLSCRTKKCEYCGNQFVVNSTELEGTNHNVSKKYCSQECYHKATIGKSPNNKEEGVNILCPICGLYFNVWKSRLSRGVKYCSRECMYEAHSRITGINHPLWKGGYDLYGKLLSENAANCIVSLNKHGPAANPALGTSAALG